MLLTTQVQSNYFPLSSFINDTMMLVKLMSDRILPFFNFIFNCSNYVCLFKKIKLLRFKLRGHYTLSLIHI